MSITKIPLQNEAFYILSFQFHQNSKAKCSTIKSYFLENKHNINLILFKFIKNI